jgi:hypothetical protein
VRKTRCQLGAIILMGGMVWCTDTCCGYIIPEEDTIRPDGGRLNKYTGQGNET